VTSRLAEHELEVVLTEASDLARQTIERGEDLRPFAVTLGSGSDLFRHDVPCETPMGSSDDAVEALAHGVRGLQAVLPRAVALARGVTVRNLLGFGATLAVCIAVEHAEGAARRCFLPYRRDGLTIVWGQPRSVPCPPWLLTSGDRDEA
jgi:hypothetical protein